MLAWSKVVNEDGKDKLGIYFSGITVITIMTKMILGLGFRKELNGTDCY